MSGLDENNKEIVEESKISFDSEQDFGDEIIDEISLEEQIRFLDKISADAKIKDVDEAVIDDGLKMYMMEISRYPTLSTDDQLKLCTIVAQVKKCIFIKNINDYSIDLQKVFIILSHFKYTDEDANMLKNLLANVKTKKEHELLINYNNIVSKNHSFLNKNELKTFLGNEFNCELDDICIDRDTFSQQLKIYYDYLDAKDKLVKSNLRFVAFLAMKYAFLKSDILDLINEGNIGLMRSVDKFDLSKGCQFNTYAYWWIMRYIIFYLYYKNSSIAKSIQFVRDALNFNKKVDELEKKTGKRYSIKELAKKFHLTYSEVYRFVSFSYSFISLSQCVGISEDATVEDFIADENANVENLIEDFTLKDNIDYLLSYLTEKEKQIISLYFGIGQKIDRQMSVSEIASVTGFSKTIVQSTLKKALTKLRFQVKSNQKIKCLKLEDYIH